MSKRHVYLLDDGEQHWIVAESKAAALKMGVEDYCIGECMDEGEEIDVNELPDEKELGIAMMDGTEEGEPLPEPCKVERKANDWPTVTATCEAWATLMAEGGMIASSAY